LGVHACVDDAYELIHYEMVLIREKRTVNDVVNNLYSAVTFHELYRIAVMAELDEAAVRRRQVSAGVALRWQKEIEASWLRLITNSNPSNRFKNKIPI